MYGEFNIYLHLSFTFLHFNSEGCHLFFSHCIYGQCHDEHDKKQIFIDIFSLCEALC